MKQNSFCILSFRLNSVTPAVKVLAEVGTLARRSLEPPLVSAAANNTIRIFTEANRSGKAHRRSSQPGTRREEGGRRARERGEEGLQASVMRASDFNPI